MAKMSTLIEQVKVLLVSPQSDQFFTDAEIREWLHEGATTIFPFLPEEILRKHIQQVIRDAVGIERDDDMTRVSIPEDLLRLKSVEVEVRGRGRFVGVVASDYNEMIGIRDRMRFFDATTYENFYYSVVNNQIVIYPPAPQRVRITYYRTPIKRSGDNEADYPEQIYPAIINWALSRGKTKDNRIQEAQTHSREFWGYVQNWRAGYTQVPPVVGITPLEQERRS